MDQEALNNHSSRRLRVAMICDIVPGQVGGSYRSAVRFATLLRERGHHVILIGSRDIGQPKATDYEGIPLYQFFAVPTPGSHRLYFQAFPRRHDLIKVFRDERIEIVHTMFASYSCFVAKRVAKELGLPVVAHVHTQPENIFNMLPSFLQSKSVYNLILRYLVWAVRGAERIICPSELGKIIYQNFDPSLPIHVISNGVDLEKFRAINTKSFTQKNNLHADRKHLLFVGRLVEEKGVLTLLRAMPEIVRAAPFAHLNLVGTGPLMAKLVNLARSLSVTDHITFLGKISDEDLLDAYNECDLFVLPSKVELEGMVVLEAMACGKPILIADSEMSASKYFVRENGLLFEPDNVSSLAQKAITILTNDALRARMGEQSLADAQDFDIHASADKLEKLYYSIV